MMKIQAASFGEGFTVDRSVKLDWSEAWTDVFVYPMMVQVQRTLLLWESLGQMDVEISSSGATKCSDCGNNSASRQSLMDLG